MRFTKFVFIFFFLISFNVFSAKYYVNDNSTAGDIYCTAVGAAGNAGTSPSTPKTTVAAILALGGFVNGDEIYVDAGTFTESNISLPAKTFKIIGAGINFTIFDNSNGGNPFSTNNANSTILTMYDLTIKNYTTSTSGNGMVFTMSSGFNLTLNNVVISNCGTVNPGSGGATCPATINTSGTLTINGGGFFCNGGNSGFGCGAINISNNTTISISNAIFYNNIKTGFGSNCNGAAIANGTSTSAATNTVTVSNCYFLNNSIVGSTTSLGGSAIFTNTSSFTITNCIFKGNSMSNTSPTGYGGVCNFRGGTISITGSLFDSNSSGGVEGTIATTVSGDITISNSKFTGNTATNTSDIYCTGATTPTVNATNCTFGDSEVTTYFIRQNLGTFTIANCGTPAKTGTFTTTNTTSPTAFTTPTVPSYTGNCTVSLTPTEVTVTATQGTLGPTYYSNLRLAFANINDGLHQGVVTVTINSSTTENTSAVIYASGSSNGSGTASYTSVTVYPNASATGLSVSGSLSGIPTIIIDGADNVVIDGRPGGTGTTSQLTISNSASSAASNRALLFQNDATNNTLKYCTFKADNSSTTNSTAGVVFLGTASSSGNNSNTINNCSVTYSNSSTAAAIVAYTAANSNSSFTISNSLIYDFTNYGIWLSTNSDRSTIQDNSIYRLASITSGSTVIGLIYIQAGDQYTISNNYIGGTAAKCGTGTYFTASNTTNFYGIYLAGSGSNSTTINGNFIKYITVGTASNTIYGIYTNSSSTTLNIYQNEIEYIKNSHVTTAASTIYGVSFNGTSVTLNFYRNKLTNIFWVSGGANAIIYGCQFAQTTTSPLMCYNNYISVGNAQTGKTYTINSTASTSYFLNNTVEMLSSSGGNFDNHCLQIITATTNYLYNNIFKSSTANATSIYNGIIYYNSGTTTVTHNYNYYQNAYLATACVRTASAAGNLATFTAWEGGTNGKSNTTMTLYSSGAVNANTADVSGTGTNLFSANAVGGSSVSITTDIIGTTRPNASMWMGCYEGAPVIYYSKTAVSTDANTFANWNSNRDGSSGSAPGAFNTANYVFIVQNGHICSPTATWTGSATGFVMVESGGALDLNAKTLSTWGSIKIVSTGVSSSGALFNSSTAASISVPIVLTGNATISSSGSSGLTLTGGITGMGYTLTIDGANATTISSSGINTSTTGALIKSGSGTLTITASCDYTGETTISEGVVNIQHATALGTTASGTTVASGAVLQIQGEITVGAEALTLNNDGISSTGSLRSIIGNNTYGGNIILSGNNVRINSDLNTLTLSGTITNSTLNLTIGGAGSVTANGVIGNGAGDLTYDGSGTLVLGATNTYTGITTISSGTVNLGANQALSNNLNNSGTIDVTASNYSLSLTGNFTNNGTFTSHSGTVTFNGGSAQTISGTTDPNFYNFTLNNASGVSISLNTTVQGTFTFNSGKFTTQGYTLTIGTNGTNGSVLGYSSSNYFIAYKNGVVATGSLKQFINSKSSVANANVYVYPIGDLTNYTPFTITINSASTLAAGAYFSMYTNASKISGLNISITTYLTRYWSGIDSGITTPNYDIAYSYSASDIISGTESDLMPIKKSGTTWFKPSGSSLTTGTAVGTGGFTLGTRTLTWSGLTSFSDYGGVGPEAVGLPIELIKFSVKKVGSDNMISWETQTEKNNDYFTIERTLDGIWFEVVGNQKGSGNSNSLIKYNLKDFDVHKTLNYYRLKQTDFDGKFTFSDLISIDNKEINNENRFIVKTYNLEGQEVNDSFRGIVIILYSDGSTEKILR